jgi:glutamate-1-semialdehyde aminotransferase
VCPRAGATSTATSSCGPKGRTCGTPTGRRYLDHLLSYGPIVIGLDAGILLPPYVITDNRICVAYSSDDIDETVAAARRAFAAVA